MKNLKNAAKYSLYILLTIASYFIAYVCFFNYLDTVISFEYRWLKVVLVLTIYFTSLYCIRRLSKLISGS